MDLLDVLARDARTAIEVGLAAVTAEGAATAAVRTAGTNAFRGWARQDSDA